MSDRLAVLWQWAAARGVENTAAHLQQVQNLNALEYERAWEEYAQKLGVYHLQLGQPETPRRCAHCGTKQTAERCESCGAPNRGD